ncbi:hypothetical protein BGZ95_007834 [Linnemannia exigua]|uniref:Uncharacterized protein n=1 Tax=Linnemannia exigua TaxID=604196 RepID=A0AAD4H7N3_9FUNG|nr:hypothetical protein BGZ95_007834 [Linnemannia exigua]
MDSPTYDTPNSIASHSNNGNGNNDDLLTRSRLFKNDHPGATQSLSEGKRVEHESQENDRLVESSSPIVAQPNTSTTKASNSEGVQNNATLYQATVDSTNQSTLVNIITTVTTDNSTTNTNNNANNNKKPTPKRAMILSGRPTPPLPPRPVFPMDLENYQFQSGAVSSNQHMQSYLSRVRQDFDHQTQLYEVLKEVLLEDTHHMTAVVDELDAMDEDPFTLDSFENLMRMHASRGKDFIIARVTTQDPNDENKHYHSYYGAHQINKVLFRTQPDEGLLHRMKARNPLNNMLVVGDVHYYIISAADIKAVRPLPTVHSSSASISSHSSRMSRCSKLAAQAIASQSASARSSPILGSDMSLFSRSSESPVSIISPLMARSILKADQDDLFLHHRCELTGEEAGADSGFVQPLNPRRRGSQGTASSTANSSTSSTPTFGQGAFHQPGRPSRLRQAIKTEDQDLGLSSPVTARGIDSATAGAGSSFAVSDVQDGAFSPMIPPIHYYQPQQHSQTSSPSSAAGHSPLFQSLMGGRVRGRSSTVSSVSSDRSSTSTMSARSHQSHASKCSTATNDSANSSNSECHFPAMGSDNTTNTNLAQDKENASSTNSSTSSSKNSSDSDNVIYKFRYLASDDDFLLRSTVRQTFKVNAFESWDAILFTISNNALREYSNQGGEQVLQPLGGHPHHHNNHAQPLPLPPSPVSAQAPPQQQHQQVQESVTTLTTAAAAAVAAQYSAQNHSMAQSMPPAPLTVRVQDIVLPNRPASEAHHYHLTDSSFTTNSSNNNNNNNNGSINTSFDTEDSTTRMTTPSPQLHRRSGGGLYSAGVNGGPRGFDIHSFSHSPHHHDQGQENRHQQRGGVEGLSRSRSHNHHLFRSLPALPLGIPLNVARAGTGEGGGWIDGEAMTTESMCTGGGSGSVAGGNGSGGRKKLRRVLSKIFSRK